MSRTETIDVFPLQLYHKRALGRHVVSHELKRTIDQIFANQALYPQHPLETGVADSTYKTFQGLDALFHSDCIRPLVALVLYHAQKYWDILNYERGAVLEISQCWANVHGYGGRTLEHNHSPTHLNAVYYVEVPQNSGPLIVRNPLEYVISQSPSSLVGNILEHSIDVRTDDLVIMPGWLKHFVPPSQSKAPRVIITFNINGILKRFRARKAG